MDLALGFTTPMWDGWSPIDIWWVREASMGFRSHCFGGQRSIAIATHAYWFFGTPTSFRNRSFVIGAIATKSLSTGSAMMYFLVSHVKTSVTEVTIRYVAVRPPIIGCNPICHPASNAFARS